MRIVDDLRYGLRALAKHRAVTIAAVLSVALGVGANTTVFTLLNAVLFRPLPVEEPSRLAAVSTLDSRNPGILLCSYPNYKDYRDRNPVFSSLLLYAVVTINLTGRGDPQLLMGHLVSGNYFSTLGLNPPIGRGFLPEEDSTPGAYPVAVISDGLWTREFGRDPAVTSRTISLNGRAFQIVGVAPHGFEGLSELYAADVWVPVAMYQQLYPNAGWVNQRRALIFAVAGRLKPGVGMAQAEAGMQVVARDLEREYPRDNTGRRVKLTTLAEASLDPRTHIVIRNAGVVLMFVSGLVLLIACANVASLLLVRAAGRTKEITVRLALGASRGRLIRQLVTESLLLAVLGGAAGLVFAAWARDIVWAVRPPMFKRAGVHLDLDGRVLAYTLAVSLLTGILFGLVPALRATRCDLASELKERTGQPANPGGRWRARSILVVCQVSFSLVALVGAGLFLRNIQNAARIDPGFDAARLAWVSFNVGGQGYNETRGREYQQRVLELASRVPGVLSARLSKDLPFHVSSARTVLWEEQDNAASDQGRVTLTAVVWPGYFRTMGIPLLRGRDFSLLDSPTATRTVIVNDVAAAVLWPGEDPLGKRITFAGDSVPAQVAGVVRHATYQAIHEEPQALIYLSLVQYYFPMGAVYLRTTGDPQALAASMRAAMLPLDRNLWLESGSVVSEIRESMWAQRLSAWLLSVFGVLALLLATVGIYGVVSYSVNQRMREIGVRMAMGATGGDVRTMILLEGLALVAIGVVGGLMASLAAARMVAGMLFATDARDALTFVLVPAILALVALAACYLPARRATRIDPATALRNE